MKLSLLLALLSGSIAVLQAQDTQSSPLITTSTTRTTFLTTTTTPSSSPGIRYPPPAVRLAPHGYNHHNFALWAPPIDSHLTGSYYITHTSYSDFKDYANLQVESHASDSSDDAYRARANGYECPNGSLNSTLSWSTCSNGADPKCKDAAAISKVSGYNIPIAALGPTDQSNTAVWRYIEATMIALVGSYGRLHATMAWGVDEVGAEWLVQYQAQNDDRPAMGSEGSIHILSRSAGGPTSETFTALITGLKNLFAELGDEELSRMAESVQKTTFDGRRGDRS